MNTKNLIKEKEYKNNPPDGENIGLANGMLLHNDHIESANVVSVKRSNLSSPKVLKYPRGG